MLYTNMLHVIFYLFADDVGNMEVPLKYSVFLISDLELKLVYVSFGDMK